MPADDREAIGRRSEVHLSLDVEGNGSHREDSPLGAEQVSNEVKACDVVAQLIPDRRDQQVPDGMVLERPIAGEAVLQDARPSATPFIVAAQCGKCHAQVAGWEYAELLAEASRGAAVVGHRHDTGELPGQVTQCRKTGGETVPTSQSDNPG